MASVLAQSAFAQAPRLLDTVAVVASRTRPGEANRMVETVTRAQIAALPARTVADVLATALNVDVDKRSAAQADVSIRGSSPEQVVILVDGVRVSDIQSAHYALDLAVPLASVERIEILRGAGSALYGPDAVGGVINIVTGTTSGSSVELRGGSFGTVGGSALATTALGGPVVTSSADFEKSDGHRESTDYRDGQGRISLAVPTSGGALRTNIGVGVRSFGANGFYGAYNSIERTTAATLDSRWDQLAGRWALAADAGTREHKDDYILVRDNPSLYENRHTSWQTGGELTARTTAGPISVAAGTDGVHEQLSSARLGGRREYRLGLFAEADAGSVNAGNVNLGVRGDRSSAYGSFLSPSLSAGAHVIDWLAVRGSGAIGFRAPTWTERYYSDPANRGDSTLAPERFSTADAGARATWAGATIDVAAWTRRATNLIDWVKPIGSPASVVWQTRNIGTATYRGVEGSLALPALAGVQYSLIGAGTSLHGSQGSDLMGKYALRPIVRQIGARASLLDGGPLSAHVELLSARRANEQSYVTGSVRLAWRVRDERFTLDLLNATNASWLDAAGQSAAGRGVYVGFGHTVH